MSPTDPATGPESPSLPRLGSPVIDRRTAVLLAAGLLILAVLRFATSAVDPWEWDEILFTRAVRTGIDIRIHYPHPPGYPLFVYPAQAIAALGVEPFRAATIVGVIGGLLSVVATGALLATLGASVPIAVLGAALYAFVPSVWLHAVRPLTDGLGAAAFAFGAAFFVWSYRRRSPSLFAVATLIATLGAGVRPQAGALLAPVALLAAWRVVRAPRGLRVIALSALGAALLSLLIWAPVIRGSGGWDSYRAIARAQAEYVRGNDSPKPHEFLHKDLWIRWWVDPFGTRPAAYTVYAFALAGLATRRRKAAALLGLYLPVAFLSMALLDRAPGPRYATAFLALPTMLAALGVDGIATATGRFRRGVSAALGAPLVAALAGSGLRPILLVASVPSPPVAAMKRLRDAPEWRGRPVAFGGSLSVHAEEFLKGRPTRKIDDEDAPMDLSEGQAIVMEGRVFGLEPSEQFSFDDPLLPRISRGRYLKVSLYQGRDDRPVVDHGPREWPGRSGARLDHTMSVNEAALLTMRIYRYLGEGHSAPQIHLLPLARPGRKAHRPRWSEDGTSDVLATRLDRIAPGQGRIPEGTWRLHPGIRYGPRAGDLVRMEEIEDRAIQRQGHVKTDS